MLFNSISYLVFLPTVVALYWLLPGVKSRQVLLLITSYFFYMSCVPVYAVLLFVMTLVNFLLGIWINHSQSLAKPLFVTGICFNLAALGYFKYASFILNSLGEFLDNLNIVHALPKHLEIVLPLAISFFVFEFIHYLTDIYKGDKPLKNPVEFALFAAFFPSQIAGPIKRYQDFGIKIRSPQSFNPGTFNAGCALLLQGLFKKVALADNFALIANTGFQNYASLGTLEAFIAALAFTFQIYFDFSGYTDMGRGSALLFGIELPVNFNLPYLASSITDFWKRWHISLSLWLKDYLYIALGGNRCSTWRRNFNLLVTMLLGGLWHGASWHFVAWGAIHGIGLIFNHGYDSLVKKSIWLQSLHKTFVAKVLCMAATFFFVVITWVFFRADSTTQALTMVREMLDLTSLSLSTPVLRFSLESSLIPYASALYIIYALAFTPNVVPRPQGFENLKNKIFQRMSVRLACYVGVFAAAIGFCTTGDSAFLYFQF